MKSKGLLFAVPSLALLTLVVGACSDRTRATAKADQLATYPLSVCPVSGETLGAMGEPYNHVHEGRLVRFCCDGCLDKFNADPSTYLAKIDAAAAPDSTRGR